MRTFTDASGRAWSLTLDVVAGFRIDDAQLASRGRTVVFTEPEDWLFHELLTSPRLIAELLWALVRPQAEADEISRDAFLAGLTPPVMAAALPALLGECADFFQCAPTSLSRLLRAQETSAEETLAASESILAALPATTSPGSPPAPVSTGELPESPSAS